MKMERVESVTLAPEVVMNPSEACTRRIGILGGTGSGKTYLETLLVEQLYLAGAPALVIDPVGNLGYGLRLAADGKSPGLPIPVIGGDHGDIGFDPASGHVVGEFLRERDASAVLDVSELSNTKLYGFVADVMEAVYRVSRKRRTPFTVVVEEAQLLLPQHANRGQERVLGAMTKWCRLSRNYGGGLVLVTQRPQSVSKEAFNLVECLFVGNLRGPHERRTVKEWVDQKGLDNLKDIIKELPGLSPGEFWCWSPEWLKLFKKIRVGKKRTYDASSTPVLGKAAEGRTLAPIDLGELGLLMKAAPALEETAGKAGKGRRRGSPRDVALETLAGETAASRELAALMARVEAERVGQSAALAGVAREVREALVLLARASEMLGAVLRRPPFEVGALGDVGSSAVSSAVSSATASIMLLDSSRTAPHIAPKRGPSVKKATEGLDNRTRYEGPNAGEKTIATVEYMDALLAVIAQHGPLNRHKLSILSGKSRSSSTFASGLRMLAGGGLIEDNRVSGTLSATALGKAQAKAVTLPVGRALYDYWRSRLGDYDRRIFETIAGGPKDGLSRADISTRTGQSRSSSTFAEGFRTLRALGLVVERSGRWRLDETVRVSFGL